MIRFLENDDGPELSKEEVEAEWPEAWDKLLELGEGGTLYTEEDELRFEPDDPGLDLVYFNEMGQWEAV